MTDPTDLLRLPLEAAKRCVRCGKQPAFVAPFFYRVRVEQCAFDTTALRQIASLASFHGGGGAAVGIATAMAPESNPIAILSSGEGAVCADCAVSGDLALITGVALEDDSNGR